MEDGKTLPDFGKSYDSAHQAKVETGSRNLIEHRPAADDDLREMMAMFSTSEEKTACVLAGLDQVKATVPEDMEWGC